MRIGDRAAEEEEEEEQQQQQSIRRGGHVNVCNTLRGGHGIINLEALD
jgi:hypothetical protein